jgi:hypothetical protein
MTYEECIENCRNKAAEFGLDSVEYLQAKNEMIIVGRIKMQSLTKKQRVINFLYKIAWLLKRKK